MWQCSRELAPLAQLVGCLAIETSPSPVHHRHGVLHKPSQDWVSSWELLSKASDEASQIRSHSILHILHSALGQSVALRIVQCTLFHLDLPISTLSLLTPSEPKSPARCPTCGLSSTGTTLVQSATSAATLATPGSEHCMPTGRVLLSVCCCWVRWCHKLFHRLAFLAPSGTAGPLLPELPPRSTSRTPALWSIDNASRNPSLSVYGNSLWCLSLTLRVPSTTFLHERDASVRSFPDEVCISTACREDRLRTKTAHFLC